MKLLSQISKEELKNKTVLLRSGLNLPIDDNGKIVDDFRIQQALPTIKYLAENCKKLIITAHIGRKRDMSLATVAKELQKHISNIHFAKLSENISDYNLVLIENLRQDPREVSLEITDRNSYAQEIITKSNADIFVQDAFSVLHRDHASITSIPKFLPSFAGFLVEKEVQELEKALNPPSPSLFILGGAKFATKEPLIRKFLTIYDKIFIGGAIANEFFESRGYEIGHSLVYPGSIPHDILYNKKIILPESVRVANIDGHTIYVNPKDVVSNMRIVDAVPPSDLLKYSTVPFPGADYTFATIKDIKFVLWNGPLGYYEGGFSNGTDTLLHMLIGAAHSHRMQLVTGGGDTLATIPKEYRNAFTHISAGGGAMLTYLQDGSLIGLDILNDYS